jgi:hypothetical protein
MEEPSAIKPLQEDDENTRCGLHPLESIDDDYEPSAIKFDMS